MRATTGKCAFNVVFSSSLLKKAHLRRWLTRALVAAYRKYASLGPLRTALHLDLFEQPGKKRVFSNRGSKKQGRALLGRHAIGTELTRGPCASSSIWIRQCLAP